MKVEYVGNNTFLPSIGYDQDQLNEFNDITADKQNATLTIKEGPSPVYVFNNITYNGTLVDGMGNPLNGVVNLTLIYEGEVVQFIPNVEVKDGFYEYNRTSLKVGIINVTAVYGGNDYVNPTNASTTYEVDKRPTNTYVTVVNDTMGNLQIDVEVKDALNGSNITSGGKLLTIAILEGTYTYEIDESGVTRITIPVTQNRKVVAITVRYAGNETYEASTGYDNVTHELFTNITAKLHNSTLSINVDPTESTVGAVYNISGNFVDANGTAIVGEDLVIRVNGTRFDVTTLEDGYYSVNYTSYKEGIFTAEVEFVGNDLINQKSNSTTFTVNKIPTNTVVSIINNTVGNVTIGVNVTDEDDAAITSGILEVTVDGTTTTERITGTQTVIGLDITTTDTVSVSVKYLGNDTYLESIGMDADNLDEPFTEITADKDHAQIGLEVIPDERFVGQSVRIVVDLCDMDENPISRAPVNITIYDQDGNVVYSENRTTSRVGVIQFTRDCDIAGNFTVNASFVNDIYEYVSANATFNVSKIPTATTVDILNNTKGNVTISVRVTDTQFNEVITEGKLNLTVDGESRPVDITGQDTIIKIDSDEKDIQVSVVYPGNGTYLNSTGKTRDGNEFTHIDTVDTAVLITINADKDEILVGEYITINGKVTYADGVTFVEDGYVIVTLSNGTEIRYDSPDEYLNGISSQYVTYGQYTANATYYDANDEPIVTSDEITFTVNRIPTKTSVTILNNTVGNVTLAITTTNNTNEPVRTGHVVVCDSTGQVIAEGNLQNGGINLTLDVNEVGPIGVNVTYMDNEIYLGSNATDSDKIGQPDENVTDIEVVPQNATITIEAVPESVIVGDPVTITGEVRDDTDAPVESGTVKIFVNGAEVGEAEIHDGIYSYEYTPLTIGDYHANATFVGTETIAQVESENVTFTATKIPTKTMVEIINNTVGNVTLAITVTNTTDEAQKVSTGSVSILDTNGDVIVTKDLTDGEVNITLDDVPAGELMVVVHYNENEIYLASNATNESAINTPQEEIIIVDVEKIPTITTVEILDNTLTNVTIGVTVTDENLDFVSIGEVYVKDAQTGDMLTSKKLTDGQATILIPATHAGELKVIVEYQENDIYYASNATNSSALGTPDENITVIDVSKIPTNTTVTIVNATVNNVVLEVNVTNKTGHFVSEGYVSLLGLDNSEIITVELIKGKATITLDDVAAGELSVIVHYNENDIYLASNATNKSAIGTLLENVTVIDVSKIPTVTSVEILNATLGNVTIGVTVTNETTDIVTTGEVYIKDANGNILKNVPIDGVTIVPLEISKAGELKVVVEYQENDIYLASNATNESAISPEEENIIVIGVDKIPTITNVEILNTTLTNVTISVNVTNSSTELVSEGEVYVFDTQGNKIAEAILDGGKATITIPAEHAGEFKVVVEYQENDIYLSSKAINESAIHTPDEEVVIIDVTKIPTKTTVEVLNNTLGNVTIGVTVTNMTESPVKTGEVYVKDLNGEKITNATLVNGRATINIPCDDSGRLMVVVEYQENEIYLASNATNESAINTPTEEVVVIDVNKIPTITSVEILNHTLGNVTISVNVTNETLDLVRKGDIVIRNASNNAILNSTTLDGGKATIVIPTGSVGEVKVIVEYLENDIYNASKAVNKSAIGPDDEYITIIDVTKIPTITSVEILNTTLGNVTIGVNVTNETRDLVTIGTVVIKDESGEEIISENLSGEKTIIQLPVTKAGELKVIVEYQENEIYLASNATNESAISPDDENIIVIGVDKIPTITNVEILNTTLTNVTISVNVTNSSTELVSEGEVYVFDTQGNKIAEAILDGGKATITIPAEHAGEFKVVVEYQENDIYLSSKAINESAIHTPDEEVVIIDVTKIPTKTTVEVLNNTLGNVTIGVTVTNMTEIPVTTGEVYVKDLNGEKITNATLVNGRATINIPADDAGKLVVVVEYQENDIYLASNATNESAIDTPQEHITVIDVEKIPTITNVEILDHTVGNVTIAVNVTNETGNLVRKGEVIVRNATNNNIITAATLDGGKATIVIPTNSVGEVKVIVEYQENDIYNASKAVNKSAIGTPDEEVVVIDVSKIPTITSVEILNNSLSNVTIGVNVTNSSGDLVTKGEVLVRNADNKRVITSQILTGGQATITLPVNEAGELRVIVEYQENDIYLASNATNSSAIGTPDENVTVIDVAKIPTATTVEILNTTLSNVTIGVSVTNMTGDSVTKGTVIVMEESGNILKSQVLANGKANITIPAEQAGEIRVIVQYQENDIYLASNATNSSAIGTPDENITVIDVTKIPTKTSVEVLNNTTTNVTVGVKVTNQTNEPVTEGIVIVKDIDGNQLASEELTNGVANITIPVSESGKLLVQVEYQENDYYLASNATNQSAVGKATENITIIDVEKVDSNLTVNTTSPIKANETLEINGTLTDEYGNPIPNAPIEISIDGVVIDTVTTDDDGNYETYTVAKAGNHTVTVDYPGNETYNPASESKEFTVDKIDLTTDANVTDSNPTNTTIQVNVTDEDGNPVDDIPVVIKDENGTVIGNGTVHNGTVDITVPLEPGEHNLTVETLPTDDYPSTTKDVTVNVPKHNSTITPDPIKNTTYGNTTQISGKLTDEDGNPIPNAPVTITVNGEDIPVKTDENGVYNYTYPADTVGVNNVTVTYAGDDDHEATKVDTKFNVSKAGVNIVVDPIKSYVEEEIILQANITDANGDKVTEGNVIFKINGVTLKDGGKLSGANVIKVPVVDGVAKYTFTATRELISSKNITAVYIANEHYAENRTDGTTPANVSLRTAQVIASTEPTIGKQRQNITLVADIYDITHNLRDVRPINDAGSYVIFKVNGLTVKDADGNVLKVPVVNGVAKTEYYIPNGMGGMKGNTGNYKNYTVTAVYHHPDYYDVRNTSNFNIEREDNISFVVDKVTMDNRTVSIDANIVEGDGDNVVGTNVVGVKVNGITLTDENGKPVLFNATNGKVDVDFKLPDNVKEVKNITLVTGNREAYGSATTTISNLPKQASVITVRPVTAFVEENMTLSARVTDTSGNPLNGGYVIYKFNGQTLRKGGLLEGDNPIVKIGVKDGWANYTFVANNKLVSSKKLDAAYSGNANYNSSKTTTSSKMNISLRKAQVVVTTTPNMVQQNQNIVFTINVTDKTHNKNNVAPINSAKALATLKVNGITLTDANNKTVQISIKNGTGSYKYRIPRGVGGKVLGTDDYKNYTVVAHYTHPDYVDASNQTTYNIEQSTTSVQFYNVTFKQATKKITINAVIKDYQKNDVVGNTRFNIKVNGVTMKDASGEVIKYSAMDGKISMTIDSITSNPKEVMIVTLGREAYSSTRATYTTILKV